MQQEVMKEKERCRQILFGIYIIIKCLVKHNLTFWGSNKKLYKDNNGNFLGLIEMIAKFDLITQDRIRRIRNSQIHYYYIGHKIQNESISFLA